MFENINTQKKHDFHKIIVIFTLPIKLIMRIFYDLFILESKYIFLAKNTYKCWKKSEILFKYTYLLFI